MESEWVEWVPKPNVPMCQTSMTWWCVMLVLFLLPCALVLHSTFWVPLIHSIIVPVTFIFVKQHTTPHWPHLKNLKVIRRLLPEIKKFIIGLFFMSLSQSTYIRIWYEWVSEWVSHMTNGCFAWCSYSGESIRNPLFEWISYYIEFYMYTNKIEW